MPDTVLKTSLSTLRVTRGASDAAIHYVEAVYWRGCPIPYKQSGYSALRCCDLSTYILSPPVVRPWEPGVYYRLPQAVWEPIGSYGPLSLIPLDIEIEHAPFDDAYGRVRTSHLSYGSHTVCGVFLTEVAEKWAALPLERWRCLNPIGWLDALCPGAVRLSHCEPLLPRAVGVSRETA